MSSRSCIVSFLALAGMLSLMNLKADAQAMGTAGASATIVTPVSISQVHEELDLGDILQNIRNRPAAMLIQKAVQKQANGNEDIYAQFVISGSPDYTYSITVPQYISVAHDEQVVTIATRAKVTFGKGKLTKCGTAKIKVEGSFVTTNLPRKDLMLAYNDADETYIPNSLPVLISYN